MSGDIELASKQQQQTLAIADFLNETKYSFFKSFDFNVNFKFNQQSCIKMSSPH